jgi:hypothetical protein
MRDDAQRTSDQGPHPLALRLAAALPAKARVLVLGPGRGRSLPPLVARHLTLDVAPEDDTLLGGYTGPYAGILSTHALLHGTRDGIALRVAVLTSRLASRGCLFATFGSSIDPRCGAGVYVPGGGWAPTEGDEAGVAHAYFERADLERLLIAFDDLRIEARDVRDIIGRWAHAPGAALPAVHWFVEARVGAR